MATCWVDRQQGALGRPSYDDRFRSQKQSFAYHFNRSSECTMSRIEIPANLIDNIGSELKMDFHAVFPFPLPLRDPLVTPKEIRDLAALRSAAQQRAACENGVEARLMLDAMTRWMVDEDPSFRD